MSYGLSYRDFLSMTMNEVIAYTEKVQQVKEIERYDLAVKIGQLFSEDGLKPPTFTETYKKTQKVRDASELSQEERDYWVNKIIDFQIKQVEKIEELR